MKHWLFKSEPLAFSIDDLKACPKQTDCWDGVRNYQARNMLRDQIKKGDQIFFYHSNCKVPGIIGVAEVVKEGYPDHTQFDPNSDHFDPRSKPEQPRWYMVDVRFVKKFDAIISLERLKGEASCQDMPLVRKGNRLSVMPVQKDEWQQIKSWAT
jgi:predicted RNA-binding protein with PUA-like domain